MSRYNHIESEKKWQKYWLENKTFATPKADPSKPKYYILDMFPYPSGEGLHVGHVTGYTGTDILARYKRQKGFNVLHPMGWDSFGLPAEQHAIRKGIHPVITTERNINTYRRQLQSVGFSYDWDKEMATSDPAYYKWTQWIFTKLIEKGLAYQGEMLVNYCPELGTVLANEEVEDGRSKEGGYPVERRLLRQWILKITAYAERLLQDLDTLNWPEHLKKLQINWIGKSIGATIDFKEEKTGRVVSVFTTCPHTLFGVTFLLISPEHPLLDALVTSEQKSAVEEYQRISRTKSDRERTEATKDKSGIFTGSYVVSPVTGKQIPLWVADYVLMGYGTGAVMGVPAHDERDFDFAAGQQLEIKCVIDPDMKEIEGELSEKEAARSEILAGRAVYTKGGVMSHSAANGFSINGLSSEDAIEKICDWLESSGNGKRTVSYKLRDWLFSRQRYWGEPIPVIHLADGTMRTLGLDELPLTLPEVEDYKPSPSAESPLAKVTDWVNIRDPKTGQMGRRETNTMPQWAGSCWYYLRFIDPKNALAAWDAKEENYWMPVDMYVGGVEHAVLHLLYARFWHKVLFDCGLVSTSEPFQTLRNQGLVVAPSYKKKGGGYVAPEKALQKEGRWFESETQESLICQIEKMSKSKLNGVTPDDVIEEFGADALRLYEMFMGPFDKEKIWNTDAMVGCSRFLNRVWALVQSDKLTGTESDSITRTVHRLIHDVDVGIEEMQFNTAIAKMMEFINFFEKQEAYPRSAVKTLLQLLNPFAPHLTEEAWQVLGSSEKSLAYVPFPVANPDLLILDEVVVAVQVNGKMRGTWNFKRDITQQEVVAAVKNHPNIVRFLEGKEVKKVIYVTNKLLNFVVVDG